MKGYSREVYHTFIGLKIWDRRITEKIYLLLYSTYDRFVSNGSNDEAKCSDLACCGYGRGLLSLSKEIGMALLIFKTLRISMEAMLSSPCLFPGSFNSSGMSQS